MSERANNENQSKADHYKQTAEVFHTGSSLYIGMGVLCAAAYYVPESAYQNVTADSYDANKLIDVLAIGGTATSIALAGLCSGVGYALAARSRNLSRKS